MPDATRRQRLLGVLKTVTSKSLPADDEESLFESGLLDSFALPRRRIKMPSLTS